MADRELLRRRRPGQMEQRIVFGDEIEMIGESIDDARFEIKAECGLMGRYG